MAGTMAVGGRVEREGCLMSLLPVHVCTCVYMCVHVCTCVYMFVHMCTCTYVYVHVYICVVYMTVTGRKRTLA